MTNRIKEMILLVFVLFLLNGCDSKAQNTMNFPFDVLEIIPSSQNNEVSVIVIKVGVQGGSTVSFGYQFYFSKNSSSLTKDKMFLWVNGLDNYTIKWNSINTVDVKIDAARVISFRSVVLLKKSIVGSYYVSNFVFKYK